VPEDATVIAMKIYLAGPLFTTPEQEFNRQLCSALQQAGQEVWLPQQHEPRERTAKAIFEEDVKGMDWAEVVVANMDGPDPDSGTCWECGYAFRKKPIILYRTDFRQAGDAACAPFNLMMSESANAVIVAPLAPVQELAAKICQAIGRLRMS
jgi:nucleoside 2-deoxyribosyltransferase